jgi:hypothetical protein
MASTIQAAGMFGRASKSTRPGTPEKQYRKGPAMAETIREALELSIMFLLVMALIKYTLFKT